MPQTKISIGEQVMEWMLMLDLPVGITEVSVAELISRHFQVERVEGHEVRDVCPSCKLAFEVRRQYECMPLGEVGEFAEQKTCAPQSHAFFAMGSLHPPKHCAALGSILQWWPLFGVDSLLGRLLHL